MSTSCDEVELFVTYNLQWPPKWRENKAKSFSCEECQVTDWHSVIIDKTPLVVQSLSLWVQSFIFIYFLLQVRYGSIEVNRNTEVP